MARNKQLINAAADADVLQPPPFDPVWPIYEGNWMFLAAQVRYTWWAAHEADCIDSLHKGSLDS